jgi:uncharacterized protein (DUF697 family)
MKKKLPRAINRQAASDSDVELAVVAPTNTVQPARPAASRSKSETSGTSAAAKAAPPEQPKKAVPVAADKATASSNAADDLRRAHAMKLIERFSLAAGAAGLIPMPLLDLAVVTGLQIDMVRRISRIYGVPFSETRIKALLASLAGSMIPGSSGIGVASMVKGVPVIGTAVGAFATPTLFTGATYAVGVAFVQHFAAGGTLADFNPGTVPASS